MALCAQFNTIALCAGIGGLELGIRIAEPGARGIAYVEREAAAAASLVASMEAGWLHPAPIWSDLATFDARPWRGLVHCLTSGDPCQPNSVAGNQRGADDERFLIDQVLRVTDECRPDRLYRENVPGNAHGQLAALVPSLERMGYRVAAGIFTASECAFEHDGEWIAPKHRRARLFIMADRDGGRFDVLGGAHLADLQGQSGHEPDGRGGARSEMDNALGERRRAGRGAHSGHERDESGPASGQPGIQAARALADARDGQLSISGRRPQGRNGPRSAGALGDAEGLIWGGEFEAPGPWCGWAGFEGTGWPLADAHGGLAEQLERERPRPGDPARGRPCDQSAGSGEPLADPDGARWPAPGPGYGVDSGGQSKPGRLELADAGGEGCQGDQLARACRDEWDGEDAHGSTPELRGICFPPFPPGPGHAAWPAILGADPLRAPAIGQLDIWGIARRNVGLSPLVDAIGRRGGMVRDLDKATAALVKSEVRRLADGNAYRIERLRATGNGVFPLCAAYAWICLGNLLAEDRRCRR